MTSTYTSNKYLEEPANGDYVNTWNVPVNANFTALDTALGGTVTFNVTGLSGTYTITSAAWNSSNPVPYRPFYIYVTGTLTANVTFQFPSGVGGQWTVVNATTGAYTVTFTGGTSGVPIPQTNSAVIIFSTGSGAVAFANLITTTPVGVIQAFAGSTAPSQWYFCYGQSVSTSTYAALFSAIGYTYGGSGGSFNLPDLRGRTLAGVDNMGGTAANRITSGVSGITGTTLGAAGGDQRPPPHSLSASTSVSISDPGHAHTYQTQNQPTGTSGNGPYPAYAGSATTSTAFTGISASASTSVTDNSTGTAANVQPTFMINYIIYAAA